MFTHAAVKLGRFEVLQPHQESQLAKFPGYEVADPVSVNLKTDLK